MSVRQSSPLSQIQVWFHYCKYVSYLFSAHNVAMIYTDTIDELHFTAIEVLDHLNNINVN